MKAWEYEYKKLHMALPVDFEKNPSDWTGVETTIRNRHELLGLFWDSQVPGSRAPESIYLAMIQAWHNRGSDVTEAEKLIEPADFVYSEEIGSHYANQSGPKLSKHFKG